MASRADYSFIEITKEQLPQETSIGLSLINKIG